MNRLKDEKSPYLQQHASNPVNWFTWSDEAFTVAQKEDKPLFISIGYATCHWCHVMNEECFEDEAVANLINEFFVPIKVDREERRDVDNIYMLSAHIINNAGGWPLTIFATPDKKPFFAATYIPKYTKDNHIGLMDLLPHINYIWKEKRDGVLKAAEQVFEILLKVDDVTKEKGEELQEDILDYTFETLYNAFDLRYGGFGKAPKFPVPHNIQFLLKYYLFSKNEKALGMALKTLDSIRLGGIYDHVDGGIHRYATDEKWNIPHFEKTLYDQALIIDAYVKAYNITKDDFYKESAEDIAEYVLEKLLSSEGGFFAGEDALADYYLFSANELIDNFGEIVRDIICFSDTGNFNDEKTGKPTGKNVIYLSKKEKIKKFEKIRNRLKHLRKKRPHPDIDKKILLDWNALMITSLLHLNDISENNKFLEPAVNTLNFLISTMEKNGIFYHRLIEGSLDIEGFADDYIFFIEALLTCYETTLDKFYLNKAIEITNILNKNFLDKDRGGYFFTSDNVKDILFRKREFADSAIPSANSKAVNILNKIYFFTKNEKYADILNDLIKVYSNFIEKAPFEFTEFLSNYMDI